MSKSRSAYGVAMMRAMEAFVPKEQRLFDDPVVLELLPATTKFAMRIAWCRQMFASMVDRQAPGVRGSILCRTRWIDDAVQDVFHRGIRTFVILGAGFDTRAYRLPELKQSQVLELDLPGVQAAKRTRLYQSAIGTSNVRFISMNFDTLPMESAFTASDVAKDQPLCFVWEGVTQYLSPAAVSSVLNYVANMPAGSEIIFTYVLEEAITKQFLPEQNDEFRKAACYQPEPWHFGIDPAHLLTFLENHQLVLAADVGADNYSAEYLRPCARNLRVSEIERIARATVSTVSER
ncbi:MAG: SAM-dependent methyltransferase [Terracidiphilus sp.]